MVDQKENHSFDALYFLVPRFACKVSTGSELTTTTCTLCFRDSKSLVWDAFFEEPELDPTHLSEVLSDASTFRPRTPQSD